MKKTILLPFISQVFRYSGFSQQQVTLDKKHHFNSLQKLIMRDDPDNAGGNISYDLVEYWKFKDTIKSRSYLQAAIKIAGKNPYLSTLSSFYRGQYFKKATQVLSAFKTKKAYAELAAWYNYGLMNCQKIAALQSQHKALLPTSRNDRLYKLLLGTGCFFLLMLLIGVLFSSRPRRKLAAEREINYSRQMSEPEQKQQLKVTKAMLDAEELKRKMVARNLHDGLGGMLAGVKIGLSGWSDTRARISEDKDLNPIISQLDSAVSALRRIVRNMVPDTLLKFGLEVAIKDLCEFYMRDGLKNLRPLACEGISQ